MIALPFKDHPLRLPAQALEEYRDNLLTDKLIGPLFIALVTSLLAGLEWYRYFVPQRPAPWLYSVVAFGFIAFFVWRYRRVAPEFRKLRLAIDGEKVVGQFLEALREKGYRVFHDLQGEGFNVDHVLVGPAGVFTVETKARTKPNKGDARINFDGERLVVGGREPDRDPIVQALAQASWLKEILKQSTGRDMRVRPVIVFPGWFIEATGSGHRDLWVLNPKALPSFLENESRQLSDEDVKLASYHLSRFIRSGERERQNR